ncbi:MAG: universal stress protein [Halobacteriaceae archaeon]
MFDRVVVATDGSESVARAVAVGCDLADRFDAEVHALYVLDTGEVESAPEQVRAELRSALADRGEAATADVVEAAPGPVESAVREGDPPVEISRYADEVDADVVVTGTRGRHGEGRLLLGSVAERVVRRAPVPVLTVRQLAEDERDDGPAGSFGAGTGAGTPTDPQPE